MAIILDGKAYKDTDLVDWEIAEKYGDHMIQSYRNDGMPKPPAILLDPSTPPKPDEQKIIDEYKNLHLERIDNPDESQRRKNAANGLNDNGFEVTGYKSQSTHHRSREVNTNRQASPVIIQERITSVSAFCYNCLKVHVINLPPSIGMSARVKFTCEETGETAIFSIQDIRQRVKEN